MLKYESEGLQICENDPVIYPRKIWVVRGGEPEFVEKVKAVFTETNQSELDTEGWEGALGGTWGVRERKTGRFGVLVWIMEELNAETAAHEAVHVANLVFRDCGIEYDCSHDEHFAFFVGKIAQWIWDSDAELKKKN